MWRRYRAVNIWKATRAQRTKAANEAGDERDIAARIDATNRSRGAVIREDIVRCVDGDARPDVAGELQGQLREHTERIVRLPSELVELVAMVVTTPIGDTVFNAMRSVSTKPPPGMAVT